MRRVIASIIPRQPLWCVRFLSLDDDAAGHVERRCTAIAPSCAETDGAPVGGYRPNCLVSVPTLMTPSRTSRDHRQRSQVKAAP